MFLQKSIILKEAIAVVTDAFIAPIILRMCRNPGEQSLSGINPGKEHPGIPLNTNAKGNVFFIRSRSAKLFATFTLIGVLAQTMIMYKGENGAL